MKLLVICACAAICSVLIAILMKRRNEQRDLESHSITPEARHTLLDAGGEVCPGDETARRVVKHALSMGFPYVRLLRGGLPALEGKRVLA